MTSGTGTSSEPVGTPVAVDWGLAGGAVTGAVADPVAVAVTVERGAADAGTDTCADAAVVTLGALGAAPEGLGGAVGVVAPHADRESRHTPAKTVRHDTIDSTSSVRDALIPSEMMSPGGKIAAGARFAFPAWAPGKLWMTT